MTNPPSTPGLVRVESANLASKPAQALARRGLTDLQSKEIARAWFQEAMELFHKPQLQSHSGDNFHTEFIRQLRSCLLKVIESDPSHEEALNAIAAVQGDARAQFWLGSAFYGDFSTFYRETSKSDVPEDFQQAEYWFNLASLQGNKAATTMAELCTAGVSFRWMKRFAAENNCGLDDIVKYLDNLRKSKALGQ